MKKERIPSKIDDTPLIAEDNITEELSKRTNGKFVGTLPSREQEKEKLRNMLEREKGEALVIPERVELVHRLGRFKEIKNQDFRDIIKCVLNHEYTHLYLLKRMPHHEILSLLIDNFLLCYIAGFESEKVAKFVEICLEISGVHSKWVHEGYSTTIEISGLYNLTKSRSVKERIEDLEFLKKTELEISDRKLRHESHEIGLRLLDCAVANLRANVHKLIEFLYSFYGTFKIKGENSEVLCTYVPDYLLLRLANLDLDIESLNSQTVLLEVINRAIPRGSGPCGEKVRRISDLQYKPLPELGEKLRKDFSALKMLPEEFQPLCKPLWKEPLREAITKRYAVWDLDKNERNLYTDTKAFEGLKNKEYFAKILLKQQELRGTIVPIFTENMNLELPSRNEMDFDTFVKTGRPPTVNCGKEPIEWLKEKQPEFQEKFENLIKDIKGLMD
jgi:hypothetical protein